MDAKLTLKLNKYVIEKAKEYSILHKRSLSRMIESYLKVLTEKDSPPTDDDIEISTFVKSMRTGIEIPADYDYKKVYIDHLAEKYK